MRENINRITARKNTLIFKDIETNDQNKAQTGTVEEAKSNYKSLREQLIITDNDEDGFYDAIENLQNDCFVQSNRQTVALGSLENKISRVSVQPGSQMQI